MTYYLTIYRKKRGSDKEEWQTFSYESQTPGDTVASALTYFDHKEELIDVDGKPARSITWECSCLQKKCGACAMVINGRPGLACDVRLSAFPEGKIKVEPLRKFPVIEDLMVDRTILYRNLETLHVWLTGDAVLSDRDQETAYRASECLQCGCCLEICPNFYPDGKFFGMAAVPLTARLLTELSKEEYRDLAKAYGKHVFAGCGKSLACREICPKRIDTEELLVNANALAVWKRKKRK